MNGSRPALSVIIPALNEEKYIPVTLAALSEQTFKDFEIIVVDGNSQDKTREIAKRCAKVVIEEGRGAGIARNTGARYARGDLLVFLDADTKPSKNLLRTYYNVFKNDPTVVAATGPILPIEKTNKKIHLGYKFVTIVFVKATILMGRAALVGSNFAVRAKAFKEIGGFDPTLITYEDWDLSARLDKVGKIVYKKKASVRTSARRAMAWGVWFYFRYHMVNMFMYHVLKRSREDYEPIR
ncbi:MAG: glycosyltransferase [Candidatus Micrarchaeota archaeon]|nr:glycosyltransferase [Candidatus Micrarchaeota archaeon]